MTPMKTRHTEIPVYITKDGSEIRELMHPAVHGNRLQSLAEATVHPGQRTHLHRHARTEELYHVTSGRGLMTLGEARFEVGAGDTVHIAPGTPHCIEATWAAEPLRHPLLLLTGVFARGYGVAGGFVSAGNLFAALPATQGSG
jgi:mannose-6-phosphate isomerase-like protein (cupin superfamily)